MALTCALVSKTAPVIDKRTSAGFMNCELPDRPTFEEYVRVGPLPKVNSAADYRFQY